MKIASRHRTFTTRTVPREQPCCAAAAALISSALSKICQSVTMSVRRKSGATPRSLPPAKRTKLTSQSSDSPTNGIAAIIPKDGQATDKKVTATVTRNAKGAVRSNVDETNVTVAGGGGPVEDEKEIVSISSDHSSDDDSSEGDEEEDKSEQSASLPNGVSQEDQSDASSDHDEENSPLLNGDAEEAEEDARHISNSPILGEEPTFGDLLAATAPEPIDVEAAFAANDTTAIAPTATRTMTIPTAGSLGTVLTQALKTNDTQLLNSCLEMNDLDGVRSTIERLPSPLVANLLQSLAERLYKRPGRAGNLMVWVQWALVSHGGWLATRRDVVERLTALNRVIKDRANGLEPLLKLKGKLDMLAAQLELRRASAKRAAQEQGDDEPAMTYVEDQSEAESEEEEEEDIKMLGSNDTGLRTPLSGSVGRGRKSKRREPEDAESSEDEDDEMPTTNGIIAEDSEDDEDEDEDENVIDDEASETSRDTGDDLSSEADEFEDFIDDGESVSEDDAVAGAAQTSRGSRGR